MRTTFIEIKRNGAWERFDVDFGYDSVGSERYAKSLIAGGATVRIVTRSPLGNVRVINAAEINKVSDAGSSIDSGIVRFGFNPIDPMMMRPVAA